MDKIGIVGPIRLVASNGVLLELAEEWRPIPSTENLYEASSWGRIRSVRRTFENARGQRVTVGGAIRTPRLPKDGRYLRMNISVYGRHLPLFVHQAVTEAFHGPRPEGMLALHEDDDALNCRPSNLRWGSHSSNAQDAIRNGRNPQVNKTACPAEHRLEAPNLRNARTRACLSCARARAYLRYLERAGKPAQDFRTLSDRYYVALGFSLDTTTEVAA